jgi:hypothetical protein
MQKNHSSYIIIRGFVQIGEGMREFYAANTFIWVCANLARKPSGGSAAQILAGVQNRALFSDAP